MLTKMSPEAWRRVADAEDVDVLAGTFGINAILLSFHRACEATKKKREEEQKSSGLPLIPIEQDAEIAKS